MSTLAPEMRCTSTAALRLAKRNWELNLRALSQTQPEVAAQLHEVSIDLEWVFARDGSISALTNGRWWADCSVPLLAGRALLESLEHQPVGSCILAPAHAGLVRAARERTGPCPAVFIVQPDEKLMRVILACHDFSHEISQHRFWIATGTGWIAAMEKVFADFPGLATPTRFIRTRLTGDEITLPLINDAQSLFTRVLAQRASDLASLQSSSRVKVDAKQILLAGGSAFRLWDFGGRLLQHLLTDRTQRDGLTLQFFDTDDALCGSPLALVHAARNCGSVVSVNLCRADCNQLVDLDVPWITWMTQPAAPPFASAGPDDLLILADERWKKIAGHAGWPMEKIRICGWCDVIATATLTNNSQHVVSPEDTSEDAKSKHVDSLLHTRPVTTSNRVDSLQGARIAATMRGETALLHHTAGAWDTQNPPRNLSSSSVLGVICDTHVIHIRPSIKDFSSHRLLWDLICEELLASPLAVDDVESYLTNRAGQLNISRDQLDWQSFVEELIIPAYQQGLARLLIAAGLPIRIWGKGWGELPEFKPQYVGKIEDPAGFAQAVSECIGLVHCWPTVTAHPINHTGKPVLHRTGQDQSALLRTARQITGGLARQPVSNSDVSAPIIAHISALVSTAS